MWRRQRRLYQRRLTIDALILMRVFLYQQKNEEISLRFFYNKAKYNKNIAAKTQIIGLTSLSFPLAAMAIV